MPTFKAATRNLAGRCFPIWWGSIFPERGVLGSTLVEAADILPVGGPHDATDGPAGFHRQKCWQSLNPKLPDDLRLTLDVDPPEGHAFALQLGKCRFHLPASPTPGGRKCPDLYLGTTRGAGEAQTDYSQTKKSC
jgi:hypothetical protein